LENTLHEHQLFSSPASPAKAQSHFEDIMVVESIGEQFEDEGSNQASCIMRQKVFKTKGLEVVVINDLSKSYVPLMLFKASFEDWFLENNDQSELMSVQVTSQLSFFNPIAGKMEP
jgi:vacuolar protein sorting-associated protein 13A/C